MLNLIFEVKFVNCHLEETYKIKTYQLLDENI